MNASAPANVNRPIDPNQYAAYVKTRVKDMITPYIPPQSLDVVAHELTMFVMDECIATLERIKM